LGEGLELPIKPITTLKKIVGVSSGSVM